jgi:hypothetical protein
VQMDNRQDTSFARHGNRESRNKPSSA